MRFRHILVTGLMVGAALFLPTQAFAEKKDPTGQQDTLKETVSTAEVKMSKAESNLDVQSKGEKANSKEKAVDLPAPSNNNVKQQISNSVSHQKAVQNNSATLKKVPVQAINKGKAAVKKVSPAAKNSNLKNKTVRQKSVQGNEKEKLKKNEVTRTFLSAADVKTDSNGMPIGELAQKDDKASSASHPIKSKVPASHKEIPTDSQAIPPPQRSSNSGGQSTDRIATGGFGVMSFVDKWFDWDQLHEPKRILPFQSQFALLHHQWVNAPPSPPPQGAPLS